MAGKQMLLEDWLDDLCVRFIINLPEEDLSSVARICFQVEEAQWFYEDFIRPLDPTLPSMTLRTFCLRIFQHCPLLASFSVENHVKAFEEFLQYKTRVPVRGAILLNHAMDSVVLVKGWKKGANWSFPRGKINKDEDDLDCAIREVYEETGLDLREAGLVPTEGKLKYIEIPMREQHLRLYVFRDVPMDTNFQPRTRKEISKIQWYKFSELPTLRKKGAQNHHQYDSGPGNNNKFYMVAPFLVPLKKWIVSQKKIDERRVLSTGSQINAAPQHVLIEEAPTEDETWSTNPVSGVPPIGSLDGATRELQRLLNMQPQTQTAQPVPVAVSKDKGSALLSLLKSSNHVSAAAAQHSPQPGSQMPHTPVSLTITEAGQPRNPHHHTNNIHRGLPDMQQSPPSFTLPANQQAAGWNSLSNQNQSQPGGAPPNGYAGYSGYTNPPSYPGYAGGQQQTYATNPINLVHPQPLPPQVQRQVFNNSVFQERAAQASDATGLASNYQVQGSQPVYGQPGQIPPQAHLPPANPTQMPLNGQSLALLNALKQDIAPPVSTAPKEIPEAQHIPKSPYFQYASSYGNNPTEAMVPNTNNSMMGQPPQPKSPLELAGSAVGPPASDQHRSALLDIFKKPGADTTANQAQDALKQSVGKGATGVASEPGKELLAQLQNSLVTNTKPVPPSGQPAHTYQNVQPDALPMDRLSIQKKPNQPGKPTNAASVDAKATRKGPANTRRAIKASPMQPTRILQRGQTLSPTEKSKSPLPPSTLPYDVAGQPRTGQTVNSSTTPSSGMSGYRPDVSQEQKRQLLSLFGASSGGPSHSGSASGETPRSRVASLASGSADVQGGYHNASPSRAGNETPISQADQSFLLGYLQSVTNNAGR